MRRARIARAAAAPRPVEFLDASAEAMPLDDASFDTVVTTWTLCTIPDGEAALGEMRRVLKPGGQLLFLEHGRSPEAGVRKWQDRVTPTWKCLCGGRHLNKPIKTMVEGAGFSIGRLDNFYMRGPKFLAYMYEGAAAPALDYSRLRSFSVSTVPIQLARKSALIFTGSYSGLCVHSRKLIPLGSASVR